MTNLKATVNGYRREQNMGENAQSDSKEWGDMIYISLNNK